MRTVKPMIAILMAVYEPCIDWLRIQLSSLNAQTYPNLRLYLRDDCSPTVPFERIEALVAECITNLPYSIQRNEQNIGSNGTFALLTQEGEGAYFAYCDQDDQWLSEKLDTLQGEMVRTGARLSCSDMYVIDGDGSTVADSITKVRRHHIFRSGEGLAEGLLFTNFVTGCTMLVDASAAKEALPFCPHMVHDHYLALWCAERGRITTVAEPLIRYRIHGGNQTGVMAGVHDKKSYCEVRIDAALDKLLWLAAYFPCSDQTRKTIHDGVTWLSARKRSWAHKGGAATVFKYRRFSVIPSVAELFMRYVPDSLFMKVIQLVRENKV